MMQQVRPKHEGSKIMMMLIIFMVLSVNAAKVFAEDEEEVVVKETLYYSMSKALVVDLPKESSMRLLQVSVSLSIIGSDEDLSTLKKHEPMLRNYFLMVIRNQEPENLRSSEGKEALQVALLEEANKMLEKVSVKTKIENVFFTSFVMQ